jgi:hypothetical protein
MTPMQFVQYEEIVNKSFTNFRKRSPTQGSRAQVARSAWMQNIKDRR